MGDPKGKCWWKAMNQPRPFNSLSDDEKWDRIRAYRAQDLTYTDDMKDFMVDKEEPKPKVAPSTKKGGRSRLNVKRRHTQRHRGGRKHRKLRKLTTRRR